MRATANAYSPEVIELIARAIWRVGKDSWPTDEVRESEDRNWPECSDEAVAVLNALYIENWCHKCRATSPNNKRCGVCGTRTFQRIRIGETT